MFEVSYEKLSMNTWHFLEINFKCFITIENEIHKLIEIQLTWHEFISASHQHSRFIHVDLNVHFIEHFMHLFQSNASRAIGIPKTKKFSKNFSDLHFFKSGFFWFSEHFPNQSCLRASLSAQDLQIKFPVHFMIFSCFFLKFYIYISKSISFFFF